MMDIIYVATETEYIISIMYACMIHKIHNYWEWINNMVCYMYVHMILLYGRCNENILAATIYSRLQYIILLFGVKLWDSRVDRLPVIKVFDRNFVNLFEFNKIVLKYQITIVIFFLTTLDIWPSGFFYTS